MTKINPKAFHLVSLGCSKNTVDSESMAELLHAAGFHSEPDPSRAGILLVNTCGFIGPAKEESLAVLKDLSESKQSGQSLIAAGCLSQRYGKQLIKQVPGINGILGTRRWMDIVDVVQRIRENHPPKPIYHLPDVATVGSDERGVSRVAIQGASAYLKIADGCRRPCAFCAIPLIKGIAVSRPIESILSDTLQLNRQGVQEIILIAQDTTDYGHDLGMKDGLAVLLEKMIGSLKGSWSESGQPTQVKWIRIMYAYPGYVTDRLIDIIASNSMVLPYLDIPLQHAHPDVLHRMRRPANIDWMYATLAKMHQAIPNLALRTTFIVGYPGETEQEFQTLLDFIKEIRFDRLGAFQFSFEPGTASESLGDPVSPEIKQERWERLMELQQAISLEKNQTFIGKTLDVLIEGQDQDISLGRTYRDAPEIDGLVLVEGKHLIGSLIPVQITGALHYDLSGTAKVSQ